MTIRSAIRLERKRLEEARATAIERLAGIDGKIEALDAAEAALAGEAPSTNGDAPKRTRTFKGRKPWAVRKAEALDAIRSEGESGAVSAGDLAAGITIESRPGEIGPETIRIPHSTAAKAIEALVEDGRVKIVGRTSRGNPVVRYKPTTVRPGEEVKA